jgi:hypothetical protein
LLREAADLMTREGVGRLPLVTHAEPRRVIGIPTRSDLLAAHVRRLDENLLAEKPVGLRFPSARRDATRSR